MSNAPSSVSNQSNQVSSNLRIATFSIAAFDILQTIPGEYKLYKKQWAAGRMSLVCGLFIFVRYMSILCLVLNGVGFYKTTFTDAECAHFYLLPPLTKMFAGLASQAIIFTRTYAISRRSKPVLIILSLVSLLMLPLQILGNTYKRSPVVGTGFEAGNCTAKKLPGDFNSAPLYYLANLIFDIIACAIATFFLLRHSQGNGPMGDFTRRVLKHGLLYALGTTVTNFLVYLALLQLPGIKVLGAFLSVAITMIMAQHLVLATANIHSTSSDQPSSTNRSRSRDANLKSAGARNISAKRTVEQIELGGVRVQTVTDINKDGGRISPAPSTGDLSAKFAIGDELDRDIERETKVKYPHM